jgi:3-oxo-5alpha-steroid 4-dehydrogenase
MRPGDDNWHSPVEEVMQIAAVDDVAWDVETDFVVVGFGGAGAAAALQAREQGLQVVAIDRAEGGGATEASGGVFYAGGGTTIQQELGEHDTPENMFAYLKLETQGVVSDDTLMRFCRGSAGDADWLMKHGVKFGGPVWKQKTSYPKVDYFLYHSDNSLLPTYAEHAAPSARGHRGVIRKGKSAVGLGGSIYQPLKRSALASGAVLDCKTEARQLIVDSDGVVVGIRALHLKAGSELYREHSRCLARADLITRLYPFFLPGARVIHRLADRYFARAAEIENTQRSSRTYRARRGVCLSTGGFIFNRPMVKHHCPRFAPGMPLGTPADDGSGIRLGQSAGAAVDRMERATAWRFINPPAAWSSGIIVDSSGARFVNESSYGATIGDAMVDAAEGKAWLILDSRLVREAWRQIAPGKVLPFQQQLAALNMLLGKRKANSIEALCQELGFDDATLRTTLAECASVARGEIEDAFGKPAEDTHDLVPPYHVIDVSLGAKLLPCTVLTVGGLAVNEATGEVRRDDGTEIKGLYAAGRTAVGLPSHLYVSGLSIADCIFSARRAARHAAAANPAI